MRMHQETRSYSPTISLKKGASIAMKVAAQPQKRSVSSLKKGASIAMKVAAQQRKHQAMETALKPLHVPSCGAAKICTSHSSQCML